jgi:hypothetical protein
MPQFDREKLTKLVSEYSAMPFYQNIQRDGVEL